MRALKKHLIKTLLYAVVLNSLVGLITPSQADNLGARQKGDVSENLKKYKEVLIGREFELTERPLSTIVDILTLDFQSFDLIREMITSQDVENYLFDTDAFWQLPQDLQLELAGDETTLHQLVAKKKNQQIIKGKVDIAEAYLSERKIIGTPSLFDSKGKPVQKSIESIYQEKKIISNQGPIVNSNGDSVTVAYSPWGAINDRWNKLPKEIKIKNVDYQYLSRISRARLLHRLANRLKIKHTPELDSYFANGPIVKIDRDAIEIVDGKPYEDVYHFYVDVMAFAKRVGILGSLQDPNGSRRFDSSLHYHISRTNLRPGETLAPLAKALSRLITVRTLANGDVDLISGNRSLVRYKINILEKGPVRLIENNRIEMRVRFDSLANEMDYVLKHITSDNLDLATKNVMNDVYNLVTPKTLQNLIGADSKLDLARDLLEGTEFAPLIKSLRNEEGLPVEEYIEKAKEVAHTMGLSETLATDPYSGFMNGILSSPDAFDSKYGEITIKIMSQFFLRDDLLPPIFFEAAQKKKLTESHALQEHLRNWILRDNKNPVNLMKSAKFLSYVTEIDQAIVPKLASLLLEFPEHYGETVATRLQSVKKPDNEAVGALMELIDQQIAAGKNEIKSHILDLIISWAKKTRTAEDAFFRFLFQKKGGKFTPIEIRNAISAKLLTGNPIIGFSDIFQARLISLVKEHSGDVDLRQMAFNLAIMCNKKGDVNTLSDLTRLPLQKDVKLSSPNFDSLFRIWQEVKVNQRNLIPVEELIDHLEVVKSEKDILFVNRIIKLSPRTESPEVQARLIGNGSSTPKASQCSTLF